MSNKKKKTDYVDRVLIKLQRSYGKDELVAHLNKVIKEQSVEIGKLKSEIQYLEHTLSNPEHNINLKRKQVNADIHKENLGLQKKNRELRKDIDILHSKLSKYNQNGKE